MVAGMSGCRPAHAFSWGPMSSHSDEQSTNAHSPGGGVQAFMHGIISPFMACWQPPVSACVSPMSPYGGSPPGVPSNSSSHYTHTQMPASMIKKPHPNDVLCGRGGATNSHVGNLNFRCLVGANKDIYVTLTKKQKMMMARAIVNAVHNQDPPGRFLQKDANTGMWFDIGIPRSLEKTSQALREKTASDKSSENLDQLPDDRDGSEAGSRIPESKSMSDLSTPTNSAPSSPLTTPKSRVSTAEAPEITIPDHLEAQFNPRYARRKLSPPDIPPLAHPSPQQQQPYLPHFAPHPHSNGVEIVYGARQGIDPSAGSQPMYPPHYMGYDLREHGMPPQRSHRPPPGRLPPPQPYPHMMTSGQAPPPPPPPPPRSPPGAITPEFGSPARRGGAQVSPGRRQEWKRRRNTEGSASRLPDVSSSSSLSYEMQNRLSLAPEVASPSGVLQSRSRRGSSPEGDMSGLAALSSAALLKLDEGR